MLISDDTKGELRAGSGSRRGRGRLTFFLAVALALTATLTTPATATQINGSIYYEDLDAAHQDLEFRVFVWNTADGSYWKSTAKYREIGARTWKGLDRSWGWYRGQALREQLGAARNLARDGYFWRFAKPIAPPKQAERALFTEGCWATAGCARRLRKGM